MPLKAKMLDANQGPTVKVFLRIAVLVSFPVLVVLGIEAKITDARAVLSYAQSCAFVVPILHL